MARSAEVTTGRIYFPDELRLLQEIFNDCTVGHAERGNTAAVAKRLMDAYQRSVRDEKMLRFIAVGELPAMTPRQDATPRHHPR